MAKLNIKVVAVLLVCLSGSTCGQNKQSSIQQKSEKSICSNIVALTGNVNINCSNLSNLTPAQKKALADIPTILKMALENQDYLDAIMAKLNTLSQPPTTNTAPGGFAVSGGTLINPQVTNVDTSALPVLSQSQLSHMQTRISSMKAKVLIKFNGSDSNASILGSDLVKMLKAAGWDADFQAGFGGSGIQIPVPIVMAVSADFSEADQLLEGLREATSLQIPGIIEADIPKGEIIVALTSRPFKRPQ